MSKFGWKSKLETNRIKQDNSKEGFEQVLLNEV